MYVLAYGPSVSVIEEKLRANAIAATLINCRFFKPIDENVLTDIASANKHIIIYETDMLAGGLGEAICAWYTDHHLIPSITRMGIGDLYVQQGPETRVRKALHIDLNTLLEEIRKYI